MGLDVLGDLVDSGHLDPTIRDEIRTVPLLREPLEWLLLDGSACTD
jgi:hypothetical protein